MHTVHGGCHCGNISYVAEFPRDLSGYTPRACDCDFCSSHGAAYVSDSLGSLRITIVNYNNVSKYKQGSRIADFLVCRNCGILTAVCYEEDGCVYGSINIRSANEYEAFGSSQSLSLMQSSDEKRTLRWKKHWFSDVKFEYDKL